MPTRHQAAVDLTDELRDLIGHLRQGGTAHASLNSLVAVGEIVQHAAILRIEKYDRDGTGRQ